MSSNEETLNIILGNVCPMRAEGNLRLFGLDLHCSFAYIVARLLPVTGPQYEVLYLNVVPFSNDDDLAKAEIVFEEAL